MASRARQHAPRTDPLPPAEPLSLPQWKVAVAVAGPVAILALYLHLVLRPLVSMLTGG